MPLGKDLVVCPICANPTLQSNVAHIAGAGPCLLLCLRTLVADCSLSYFARGLVVYFGDVTHIASAGFSLHASVVRVQHCYHDF